MAPMRRSTVEPTDVMRKYKVIAVVGASKNPEKDANTVPVYLQERGYTIVPVNPTADIINGARAYPSLSEIPEQLAKTIEVVDVFRPSEEFPQVARQVVGRQKGSGRRWGVGGLLGRGGGGGRRRLAGG